MPLAERIIMLSASAAGIARFGARSCAAQRAGLRCFASESGSAKEYETLIGGKWVDGSGATFDVFDPATMQRIATAPDLGVDAAEDAIGAAQGALASWRATLPKERSQILERWHDLMMENQDELAQLAKA